MNDTASGVSDLVVIGGGLAGLSTANRAAQLGCDVIVLEAGRDERYMCNSRVAMGFVNAAVSNIDDGPQNIRHALAQMAGSAAKPELLDAFATNAGPALQWLRREGVRTVVGSWRPGSSAMLYPPSAIGAGLNWRGRGPDLALQRLERNLIHRRGQLMRGYRARELIMSGGCCEGVVAEGTGGMVQFSARSVVIADGGFQANAELLQEYVAPKPERLLMRNAKTARGDGMKMAEAVGAALIGLGEFYGHVQSKDALDNRRLWPYPTVDMPISGGIAVDSGGRRFADEGLGGIYVANMIAKRSDPLDTFAVFDHDIWKKRAIEFPLPANPLLVTAGATIFVADTIAVLAAQAGIAAEPLAATVEAYNRALGGGQAAALTPPRSASRLPPMSIARPPFYAVPLVAGVTYTYGGIAIDAAARVLNARNECISGLLAAGSCTGGHEGGPGANYTGGLGKALTFGWIAGTTAASSGTAALRQAV